MIPAQEMRVMPIGELSDCVAAYQILKGVALEDTGLTVSKNNTIPNLK